MSIHDLIEALRILKIAELKSVLRRNGSAAYTFEAHLPEFPFRSRPVWYTLTLQSPDSDVQTEEIEALLLHFQHGQVEVSELQAAITPDLLMPSYPYLLEKTETSYGAWAPDLPGCVAAGSTLEESRRLMREAIRLHVESLREHGEPVPEPATLVEYADVAP